MTAGKSKTLKPTKKQQKELDKLMKEITDLSKEMVDDYTENPSEMSSSVVQVNGESPYLDETFKGNSWKKIIKGGISEALSFLKKKKKKA